MDKWRSGAVGGSSTNGSSLAQKAVDILSCSGCRRRTKQPLACAKCLSCICRSCFFFLEHKELCPICSTPEMWCVDAGPLAKRIMEDEQCPWCLRRTCHRSPCSKQLKKCSRLSDGYKRLRRTTPRLPGTKDLCLFRERAASF